MSSGTPSLRAAAARDSMAAAIAADPLYKPDANATSPRIVSTFQEVRRDVLPGLIGELYADALSDSTGLAPDYLSLIRYNAKQLLAAMR